MSIPNIPPSSESCNNCQYPDEYAFLLRDHKNALALLAVERRRTAALQEQLQLERQLRIDKEKALKIARTIATNALRRNSIKHEDIETQGNRIIS